MLPLRAAKCSAAPPAPSGPARPGSARKRRLAYPINDLTEGYYVLMTFTAAAAIPAELDRIFRITDGVMRSLIVCKDQ